MTSIAQCADFASDGGFCPGLEVAVSEMQQRKCPDIGSGAKQGSILSCILVAIDITGSLYPNAVSTLRDLVGKSALLDDLGLQSVEEVVLYDKCQELFG